MSFTSAENSTRKRIESDNMLLIGEFEQSLLFGVGFNITRSSVWIFTSLPFWQLRFREVVASQIDQAM